jgi:two-component system KDP operon response regulator KdpE
MNGALKILLVEDEALNRSLVQAILSRARDERLQTADVREADTLDAARQSLSQQEPEVILLDVQLPDGSGLDLARQLRTGSAAADGPLIIALTAGALPEQQAAAIEAGCDAVILKPYTADQFESVLVMHLDHRAGLRG